MSLLVVPLLPRNRDQILSSVSLGNGDYARGIFPSSDQYKISVSAYSDMFLRVGYNDACS